MSTDEIRHKPRKRFGQHFLVNERIADRIVDSADITADDTVLEIGPGRGILTTRLLDRAKRVIAVEIDRDLSRALSTELGGIPGLQLVELDILDADLPALIGPDVGRIKVVSNIPYNITSPILNLLVSNRRSVAGAVLMMQREVAGRLTATTSTKDYGLLTLNAGLCAETVRLFDVKPGSFFPPPEVVSTVVRMTISPELLFPLEDEQIFYAVTGAVFRQRRKMLRNTLPRYLKSFGLDSDLSPGILAAAGIDETQRPETVSVEKFVVMSNEISRLWGGMREESR